MQDTDSACFRTSEATRYAWSFRDCKGLPGRILSQLAVRVPEEDSWADLADRALGLVVVQVRDDPLPWREAVGHAPRYSALRAFVQAQEAWELRVDRQGRTENLRKAVIADSSFLLAWFELAARAPGASISDSTIWVPNGPDTLRLPLNTEGALPDLERRLEGIARRPLTALERSVWLAAARRRSRVQALGHWRDAAHIAPTVYLGRAVEVAVWLGAYNELLTMTESLPAPPQGTESYRHWILYQVLALQAVGRYEEEADLAPAGAAPEPGASVPHESPGLGPGRAGIGRSGGGDSGDRRRPVRRRTGTRRRHDPPW